ncbi:MAG TPA: carbohydrate ABC transporter permease [Candidatus Limnocylindrales bacterium]|nr:carbohydrate ABC transporter permease [Candidatus Limnocylindrales bacterium]
MKALASTALPHAPAAATLALPARRRPPRSALLARAGLYLLAVLFALWVLVPIWLIAVAGFSTRADVYDFPKPLLPRSVSTDTMAFFVGSSGVLGALRNSIIVALVTVGLATVIGAPAGYAIARWVFRGREAFRLLVLSTRAFPIVILSIPLAVAFLQLGIYDSIWAVALMHTALALPFAILITASVFVSVPVDLEEAAMTMGCSRLDAFRRVSLPLALPGLAAAAIFTFVLSWNEVFAAVILTLRERTLPALVLTVLNESPLPFRFAGAFFMLAPSFVFIFVIRRYLFGLWGRVLR